MKGIIIESSYYIPSPYVCTSTQSSSPIHKDGHFQIFPTKISSYLGWDTVHGYNVLSELSVHSFSAVVVICPEGHDVSGMSIYETMEDNPVSYQFYENEFEHV